MSAPDVGGMAMRSVAMLEEEKSCLKILTGCRHVARHRVIDPPVNTGGLRVMVRNEIDDERNI